MRSQYEAEKSSLLNKIIRGEQSIYLGQKTDTEFNREVILKIFTSSLKPSKSQKPFQQ